MKIAISSKGPDITSPLELGSVEPNYWIIYDTGDHSFEVVDRFKQSETEPEISVSQNKSLQTADIIISGKKIFEQGESNTHYKIGQFSARSMSVEDVAQTVVKEKSLETDKNPNPKEQLPRNIIPEGKV